MKTCTKCSEEKPLSEFYRKLAGHQPDCKECQKAARRARHAANPFLGVYHEAKKRAKRKGLEFDIAFDELEVPDTCPALGIPLSPGKGTQHDGSPSLDRIDPTRGYVTGNVAVISLKANRIKNDATKEELLAIAEWLRMK